MSFVNRQRELRVLENAWASPRAELVLVYGRRRVGKSELIQHFLRGKPHVYYVGARKTERDLLVELTEQVRALTGQSFLLHQPFVSWDAALSYLADQARERRLVVALDELPYMCEATPSLPSTIQRWWDSVGRHLPIVLVLSGSFIGFMEKIAGESGELYGRRTRQLFIEPFDYYDAGLFFPDYSPTDRMRAYAVLGGMPAYLARFDPAAALAANIGQHVLDSGTFLREEARWVLIEELRSEAVYSSVLGAIARDKTRRAEIATSVGAESSIAIGPYLDRLREMRLIDRRLPVTDDPSAAVRRGIHVLADPYLAFWFRFVDPNRTYLEAGLRSFVLDERILPNLDHHTSSPFFEDAARQYLKRRQANRTLPFVFDRIGAWWRGQGADESGEIDVVAVDGKQVCLVGECKWTNEWVKIGDLNRLREKAVRAGFPSDVRYALFSRSGFDPNLVELARAEGILLVGVDDMYDPAMATTAG